MLRTLGVADCQLRLQIVCGRLVGVSYTDRLLIVFVNEKVQCEVVHSLALREGERAAHEATQALAQRVVPAFDVADFTCTFAAQAVSAPWKHLVIGRSPIASGHGDGSPAGCAHAGHGPRRRSGLPRSRR